MLAQLIRLLSQPPGTIIYHLVTLFAIQAVLALALWQWRRARLRGEQDIFAGRLLVAAGGLLALRLLLLLVTSLLLNRPDLLLPSQIIPPLEQAFNSISLILIIWALVEPPARLPRLADGLAVFLVLITAGMWLSFAQSWAAQAITSGPYNSTIQATIWAWYQFVLLSGGMVWLLARRPAEAALRLAVVGVLWLAHLAHLWNYPEIVPSGSDIAYWIRLGYLIALPLLAVLAYRHTLRTLLAMGEVPAGLPAPAAGKEVAEWLHNMVWVLNSLNPEEVAAAAVQLVRRGVSGDLVALALSGGTEMEAGPVWVANPAGEPPPDAPAQTLTLTNWASLRLALEQRQTLVLQDGGMGAYQLQELAAEFNRPGLVQMVVEPLLVEDNPLGVLIVGSQTETTTAGHALLPLTAAICSRAIANAQSHRRALHDVAPLTAATETTISGRILALEKERNHALAQIGLFSGRLQESAKRQAEAQAEARYLAQEVARLKEQHPAAERVARLEEEIKVLREALYEAEEAMSMIAASEEGLSTDWVLMTISRYSGELEGAQMRISELEAELARLEPGRLGRIITSLLQELRTPLTSIEGYTDLLLAETAQIVNSQHRDFLQRVQANAGRMHLLLEQIVRVAASAGQSDSEEVETLVDVRREVENAVSMVLPHVRKKNLVLNLDVADDLLPLPLQRNDLCDIMVHLLNNACLASATKGQMTLRAHMDGVVTNGAGREAARQHYFHIAVSDSSSGILPEDLPRVFDPQYEADNPLITGIGETNAGLAVAEAMVAAHGGRLWVDSRQGEGNTFSVLLPLSAGAGKEETPP